MRKANAAAVSNLPTNPVRNPAEGSAWRTRLALGLLGGVGQLPRASLGAVLEVRLSPSSQRAGVSILGTYLAPREAEVRQDVGGAFSAAASGLAFGWAPFRSDTLAASLAGGGQLGIITGTGFGFTATNQTQNSWLINATLEAELGWVLNAQWESVLKVGVGVPLWRDTFESSSPSGERTSIFTPAPLVGSLAVAFAFAP
jgi:hypothetical protein